MLEGDGALEHLVLLKRRQGPGHLQQCAQLEDEGLGAGQLAGRCEPQALPAGDAGGDLGMGGAVAWCFCVISGVADGEIIPGKQVF
jgi:hypothetical protein